MPETMQAVAEDHPVAIAWRLFRESADFANAKKWAVIEEHTDGALWHCFLKGFEAGLLLEHQRCAALTQSRLDKARAQGNIVSSATAKAILAEIQEITRPKSALQ